MYYSPYACADTTSATRMYTFQTQWLMFALILNRESENDIFIYCGFSVMYRHQKSEVSNGDFPSGMRGG